GLPVLSSRPSTAGLHMVALKRPPSRSRAARRQTVRSASPACMVSASCCGSWCNEGNEEIVDECMVDVIRQRAALHDLAHTRLQLGCTINQLVERQSAVD